MYCIILEFYLSRYVIIDYSLLYELRTYVVYLHTIIVNRILIPFTYVSRRHSIDYYVGTWYVLPIQR
jgi:hypothetical protein